MPYTFVSSSAGNDRQAGVILPAHLRPGVSANPDVKSRRTGCFYSSVLPAAVLFLAAACSPGTFPEHRHSGDDNSQIYITKAGFPSARTMDLFFFDDDAMRRLDSYQHFDSPDTSVFHAGSITGRKLLVAVANYGSGPSSWAGVYSYADVEARLSDIANESLDYPVLTGETRITAEAVNTPELFIIPLFSSISLESLRCDFHDKPYRGARLENIRVYLTNVRRDCGILDTASSVGTSWLNLGGLVDADMESVSSPGMFSRVLDESVGEEAVSPGVELYCYPNSPEMETMGTPVTRLVVEGTLCGKKYYYPIDLRGIGRNERYAVDLLITRTGTDSPDTPASSDMIVTLMKVLPWEEKEETVENF